MVKVRMMTTASCKTDLFSEKTTLREVFDQFCMDYEGSVNTLNGARLPEEKLDCSLISLSHGADELRITSAPKPDSEYAETPGPGVIVLNSSETELTNALMKVREALDEAFRILGKQQTEELPF